VIISSSPTHTFLGQCPRCIRPVRAEQPDTPGDRTQLTCTECQRTVPATRLYATRSSTACDGACMFAVGPSCSCSCEGANHGAKWAPEVEELTIGDALARLREKAAKEAARRAAKFKAVADAFTARHGEVVEFLNGYDGEFQFLTDMQDQLRNTGQLSDAQADGVRRCAERAAKRVAIQAEREAQRLNAGPVPTGKARVEGVVLSVRDYDAPGPSWSTTYKMLVALDNGSRVWSTVPKALADVNATTTGSYFGLKGSRVAFTATITAKAGDPTFGTASRPSAAELLVPANA
jgi:hypothetical protein